MKPTRLLIGLAVLIVLGALGYLWFNRAEPGAPATTAKVAAEQAPEAAPAPAPEHARAKESEPEPAPAVQQTKKTEELTPAKPQVKTREVAPPGDAGPGVVLPSFDVVRIEPSGETVTAGRATPGSTVRLFAGTRLLGEAVANEKGEWVIVPRRPLAPGAHELSLESRLPGGEILLSENVVVVNVPAPALVADKQPPPAAVAAAPAPAPAAETAPAPAPAGAEVQPAEAPRPLAVLMARAGTGASRILQAPEPVPSTLGDKALLLETVDYDDRGRAVIGGRGEPGAVLLLYLDNRPAGRTLVGADGRWRAKLEGEVPFGVHTLRVDQVDRAGKVIARVESPFSRARLLASAGGETAVIVQPGNSLWRIARRIYGEGVRYSVIYTANRDRIGDPDLIFPGQIFTVPAQN